MAFIDIHDYVSKDYAKCMYAIALRYSADIVFTNNIIYVRGKKQVTPEFNKVRKWQKEYSDNPLKGLSSFNIKWDYMPNNRECISINIAKVFAKRFLTNYNLEFSKDNLMDIPEILYKSLAHKPTIAYNHEAKYFMTNIEANCSELIEKEPREITQIFKSIFNYYLEFSKDLIIYSNYWNFSLLINIFDNYKKEKIEEFYDLIHNLFLDLGVTIDEKKNPFLCYNCELFKSEGNYTSYKKKLEEKKRLVNNITLFIPSNKLRKNLLDYFTKKK